MIYLDYHAATPLAEAARLAMREVIEVGWANPSSVHGAGRAALRFLDRARQEVAHVIAAEPADIVFTSGGTEACNLGVLGLVRDRNLSRVVTSAIEHPAVEAPLKALETQGVEVIRVPVVDKLPNPSELGAMLDERTLLAWQWANHETGTLFPIADYAEVCRERGACCFVDATQALGRVPISVNKLEIDALALASQKIGGPSGAGALWVSRKRQLAELLHGGGQERGRRPGTPGTIAIAGFGAACATLSERYKDGAYIRSLRDRLESVLVELGCVVNGVEPRIDTVTNVSVPGWRADLLVAALDVEGLCTSAGAACSSGMPGPSPVLRAMYPDQAWRAESGLRLSLGPGLDEWDIDRAIEVLRRVLPRGMSEV